MNELKPCPFCGGEAELTSRKVNSGQTLYRYRCASCHAAIGRWHGGISGHDCTAAETWNTRAERTCNKKKHLNLTIGDNFLTQSGWDCSECGGRLDLPVWTFYCPTCGAKVVD